RAAHHLGGSPLLDLHVKDIANGAHPSQYDYTSIYDLMIFRRLATDAEVKADAKPGAHPVEGPLAPFTSVQTKSVAFVVFDRLLITVHPSGCFAARTFIERFLSDAVQSEGLSAAARSRLPTGT